MHSTLLPRMCPVREEHQPWLAALPHPDSRDGNTSEPWHDAAGARDAQVAHLRALERVRTTKNWCSVGKKWKANTPVLIEIQSQSSETGKHTWKLREASALLPSFCISLNFCLRPAGRSGGCGQSPRTGWGPRSVKPWVGWWSPCSAPRMVVGLLLLPFSARVQRCLRACLHPQSPRGYTSAPENILRGI